LKRLMCNSCGHHLVSLVVSAVGVLTVFESDLGVLVSLRVQELMLRAVGVVLCAAPLSCTCD
jgi:hypothetical protein